MTEPANPSTETDQRGHPAVLVVVCTALFFGVVNGSAVAVVLPEIGADPNISSGGLSWVLSGFLLTYGVAIPFYGRLANRFGARRLFLIGVGVFALGSALSALATGLGTLLAARTVQAVGGAAVPGLGMTLASRAFPEQRRGMVLGVASATMGLGAAAGPLGAGIISELADWRYLFGISALAALNVPLGMRYLDRNETVNDEPLDLAGGALFGLGVAATLFFVTQGSQSGWTDGLALTGAAVAVVAFVTFALHQRRGATPFIPASLLANRSYVLLTMLGFVITFGNLAAQIGYPFLFNALHGMSTLDIGIALIPAALTTAVVGIVAGRIVDRIGAAVPVRVGAVLMITATIGLSSWVGTSRWTVAIIAMAFAAGFALVNTPLAGGRVTIPVPAGWTAAFTVVAGSATSDSRDLAEGDTPVFNDDGTTITVTSESGGQLLLMCGEPIAEPIAMGGGFVMNTPEEIDAAFDDDRSGRMGQLTPTR